MSYPSQPGNWNDPSWPSQPPAGYQDPSYPSYPASGQPVSGQPVQDPYATPGYPAYGYPPIMVPPPTNGMAVAAMVIGILGVLGLCGYGVGGAFGVVGAILGHVARKQIRERGESGDGLALAGIITGWISTGIALLSGLAIILIIVFTASTSGTY